MLAVEGDAEMAGGIRVLPMPGHTPGGPSVVVNTRQGRALTTGFCCNGENFPSREHVVAPGVHINAIEAYESALRVLEIADILISLHDLAVGRAGRIP